MSASLPEDLKALVRMSARIAAGDPAVLDEALARAAALARTEEVEEALLQSYLFAGYPAALNALGLWRARVGPLRPVNEEPTGGGAGDAGLWAERGVRTCRRVYGDQYEALRENVRRVHPDLDTWMVTEGYGKVLGRPGLELDRRELCIVAILARQGPAVARQLYSHLRGALRLGVTAARVEAVLEEALEDAALDVREAAFGVWRRLSARAADGPPARTGGVDDDDSADAGPRDA